MIPKIIHQIYGIYQDGKPMPEKWLKFSKNIKNSNSNWEYKLWDHKDCIKLLEEHYPWFLEIYKNYKYPIQKADAIRPFILYHYGGIYLDLDYNCLKKLDTYFNKDGVYILESSHFGMTNSLMASSKNHLFWKIVMKRIS